MKNAPKISVLMPVYNVERYVHESIYSVLEEHDVDLELIIIDDGSTDRSKDIIQSFSDPRIKYFDKKNGGLASALNFGLPKCKGEFVARIDPDDLCINNRLKLQANFLDLNQDCILVHSNYHLIDEYGKILKKNAGQNWDNREVRYELMFKNCMIASSVMFRRSTFSSYGHNFNLQFKRCEDYEYWCQLIPFGRFGYLNQSLISYRVHSKSITFNETGEMHLEYASQVIKENFERFDIKISDDLARDLGVLTWQISISPFSYVFSTSSDERIKTLEQSKKTVLQHIDNIEFDEVNYSASLILITWALFSRFISINLYSKLILKSVRLNLRVIMSKYFIFSIFPKFILKKMYKI